MAIAEEPLEVWFMREVLSHHEPLARFLSRLWGDRDEVEDFRQEAYARVYQAALKDRPKEPRAFLFATARHITTDRARRERVVAIHPCSDAEVFDRLIDEISPEQRVSAQGELTQVARALARLTPQSREVLWLRRVQDCSQRETAERLGISEKTVEKHLSAGVRRLLKLLGGRADGRVGA
jgi:RNA polymerase sigma factor (sigma-70 family)